MSKSETDMQLRGDLGKSWDFLASSLEAKDFTPSAAAKMRTAIDAVIYDKDAGVATVSVLGILEMIKHELINNSRGGDNE